MKKIGLDLVRVTEGAAIASSYWVGSGEKVSADQAATEAMRRRLNKINFLGKIKIGEGKKDKSEGLFEDELVGFMVGRTENKAYDIAVDPIEGTRPTVNSGPEAISTIAISEPDTMFTTEEFYMNKLAYGPQIAKVAQLYLNDPIERTIQAASMATGKAISKIMVCILDRPRHNEIILKLRNIGVRIKLIQDCDVSGAIATCMPDRGVDLLYGIGGAPEALLTACAIKCLKGGFQAQIAKKIDEANFKEEGEILDKDQLVRGECAFAATGITDGSLLKGVRFSEQGPVTQSIFMRSESNTIRWLTTYHGN